VVSPFPGFRAAARRSFTATYNPVRILGVALKEWRQLYFQITRLEARAQK